MDESQIPEHIILRGSLGTSAQTAHKAILSKIAIAVKETKTDTLRVSPKWRSITDKNIECFHKSLNDELRKLSVGESGYKLVLAALNRAKTTSLGRIRPRPKSAKYATPELDHLHADLGAALEKYRVQPNQYNLNKCISSENKVQEARRKHHKKILLDFLDKLESLDQVSKMRTFYDKIRTKTNTAIDPLFVIADPYSPVETPSFSSSKKEYLEYWAKYMEKTFAHNKPIPTFKTPNNYTYSKEQDVVKI